MIGIAGRAAPEASVSAVALNRENLADAALADDSGRFVLSGLDFTDTVLFMVAAKTRRGKPTQRIDMDGLYPRPPLTERPPFPDSAESVRKAIGDYLKQQKMQYAMIDGMKIFELEGVEVRASNPKRPKITPFSTVYDTAKLAPFKPMLLYNYLSYFTPDIRSDRKNLYVKKGFESGYARAQLNLNGKIVDLEYLRGYYVDDVEYVHVVSLTDWRTQEARARDAGINLPNYLYRVDIYLKRGREYGVPDVQTCQVIGYSEDMEFYHPVYDTPEKINNGKPDERTTLFWNPYVKTDPNGNTTIEFYTNDTDQVDYDIDIEGLDLQGTAYRYRQKL
nr:hypothetical protein [uncultured Alistipes sp.]